MFSLSIILNWLLPLLYLALLVDYGATFFLRTKTQARNPWLIPVIGIHAFFLILRSVQLGQVPLADMYEILSVLALLTTAVYAVVEFASRDRRTGMFVFLLVFLFQYTSSNFLAGTIMAEGVAEVESQSAGCDRLHIILALAAYTAFAISAVYGMLHLLAERNLRKHRFGVLFDRLPSLDLLGRMTWHALLGGFIFITITIITAPLLLGHGGSGATAQSLDAKVIVKIVIGSIAWLVYVVAVLGKLLGKWTSRRISSIAVTGFVVIMILLIVSGILS
ncbi:MAG: hypothetical protein GWP14_08815 [Actinobacteria bacterium]|nr:hypothetical protein [Actinomycetota bacterium]